MVSKEPPLMAEETPQEIRGELEQESFEDVAQPPAAILDQAEIEARFRDTALRIVVQRNDFFLPNLLDMMTVHKTINVSPVYQRRLRWDIEKKSKLIESFLVNIPVPPVFLYETEFARYEVMDGQQRLSTIREFFSNEFALDRIDILTELTGKRYHQLPLVVKAGLERRALGAIVLLKESTQSDETAMWLRQKVFERLNTGGIRLNAQEVRNCLQAGPFNDLLHELARSSLFTKVWGIPPQDPNKETSPSARLAQNPLYMRMADNEIVLRFFALLDPQFIAWGMKATLDRCMKDHENASPDILGRLRAYFERSLEVSHEIFAANTFRLPPRKSQGRGRLSTPLYDAVMVAVYRNLDRETEMVAGREVIAQKTLEELSKSDFYALVVGRANTRQATLARAEYMSNIIRSAISR